MKNVKIINYGLVFAAAIITNNVNADTLNGKYKCLHKAMDIDYKIEFGANSKYKQNMELFDIIGIEKGNYSMNGKIISFAPTENTRGGKKKNTQTPYKRNIISNIGNKLIMTNMNDDDKIICTK
jgi:hypothetical protein